LVAMRQEREVLSGQGDREGAAELQAAMDRVPVSEEIRDDPQGYLERLDADAAAARMDMSPDQLRAEEGWINSVIEVQRDGNAGERDQVLLAGHGAFVIGDGTTVVPED